MTTEQSADLPRVLVVDDSRIVRAGVKKHLSGSFEIVEEVDGEAGWERLSNDPNIAVLMSDLSMPRLDGFGLLQRIRRSPEWRIKHLPVIIISGEEDLETKNRAVDMGANDFVTKSTDRAEMVARVSAAVKLARAARDAKASEEAQVKEATTDPQTGVATEHLLQIEGEKALAHAVRYQGETTLVVFELDDFDALRTDIGDKVADQLIGLVAKLVAGRLRKEETLARLEGPRFAVVLFADLEGSQIYVDRLRETIAAARVNFKRRQLKVTASVGVANARVDGTEVFEELMQSALARLRDARAGECEQAPPEPAAVAPSLEQALGLLAAGDEAAVAPYLPQLLVALKPLLDLAARLEAGKSA
jgi:diguanylate cyclase (GGDEF)-like protein